MANVYLPPPSVSILYGLIEFVLDKPGVPVIVIGEFNMVMDRSLARFPPGISTTSLVDSRLPNFLKETGLGDIWITRNPETQQYLCFSRTHSTLSRIDLVLGNDEMMPMIKNVNYNPRGLSDHSPVTVSLELGEQNHPGGWRLIPFWIDLMGDPCKILVSLGEFIDSNQGSASEGIVWDTLKAFLWGLMIQQISKIKKQTKEWERSIGERITIAEEQYINKPTPNTLKHWIEEQHNYRLVALRKSENKYLSQSQVAFGEG